VNAEFMPFLQHERGIDAQSPGTGDASVTDVHLCSSATHRDHKLNGMGLAVDLVHEGDAGRLCGPG
jgi:hypothetical protein